MNMYKSVEFIIRQYNQIKKGNYSVLYRKLYKFIILTLKVFFALPFVPFAIIIRILRPIKVIRMGKLITDRLGHFAFEPELYLCERDVGLHNKKNIEPIAKCLCQASQQVLRSPCFEADG